MTSKECALGLNESVYYHEKHAVPRKKKQAIYCEEGALHPKEHAPYS